MVPRMYETKNQKKKKLFRGNTSSYKYWRVQILWLKLRATNFCVGAEVEKYSKRLFSSHYRVSLSFKNPEYHSPLLLISLGTSERLPQSTNEIRTKKKYKFVSEAAEESQLHLRTCIFITFHFRVVSGAPKKFWKARALTLNNLF